MLILLIFIFLSTYPYFLNILVRFWILDVFYNIKYLIVIIDNLLVFVIPYFNQIEVIKLKKKSNLTK